MKNSKLNPPWTARPTARAKARAKARARARAKGLESRIL